MKRLYVSDLDGTLLNRNGQFSDMTIEVVNRALAEGIHFTVSTARTPATALAILEPLHLQLPVMLMNGVMVYDVRTRTCLKKEELSEDTVMLLLGLIKTGGYDCFLHGFTNDRFVTYYDSVASVPLNYFRNERIMKYGATFTEVEDLSLVTDQGIVCCMLRDTKKRLEGLHRELSVVKGIQVDFYPDVYSDSYYMMEIKSDRASKEAALLYLRKQGRYDSVVAFGDNLNDISLLHASDCFYAVANAHPELQNMAHSVIPSNEEDGVARYIEQMLEQTGEAE